MDMIREDVFRKQLKQGLSGGYLFFGDEDYLKAHALKAAQESVAGDPAFAVFNDVRMDAMDYTPDKLLNALMPPPMMSEQKLISVCGLSLSSMRPNEIEDLCEGLATLSDYDYNVLILSVPAGLFDEGTLPKRPSALFKRLSDYLTPVRFESIAGARLVGWVGKHFAHHGVQADPSVCAHLIDRCGKSMYHLASETEKLSYYVLAHGRTAVTSADVEEVAIAEIASDAFALTNAVLDGKHEEALNALSVMKFKRMDPVLIMGEVARAVCDLMAVKALQREGLPTGEIAAALKMNEYRARLYAAGAASKSMERMTRAVYLCSEADLSLKLSPQGYAALEKLVACL